MTKEKFTEKFPQKSEIESWKVFPRETAWLRKLNPNNPNDIEMYELIEAQPETSKWMEGETITREEIKALLLDEEQAFYGVCEEKGDEKAEGWVSLYEPETELVERLIERGLIARDKQILEISFARYVDLKAAGGKKTFLIPSAIRQICFSLIEKQKKLTIIGFTSSKNLFSEGVLKNSGFVIKGKIPYNPEAPEEDNFWVLDKNELEKILARKKSKN